MPADFIDLLLFKDTANPLGQPGDWPASSQAIVDPLSPLTYPAAVRMTMAEYEAYYAAQLPAWLAWFAPYDAAQKAQAAAAVQAAKEAAEPDLVAIRDQATAAITRLDQIIGGVQGATLGQTQTAVKDMATTLKQVVKSVARLAIRSI